LRCHGLPSSAYFECRNRRRSYLDAYF
jgi:hypothetical protein